MLWDAPIAELGILLASLTVALAAAACWCFVMANGLVMDRTHHLFIGTPLDLHLLTEF